MDGEGWRVKIELNRREGKGREGKMMWIGERKGKRGERKRSKMREEKKQERGEKGDNREVKRRVESGKKERRK